MSDDPMAEIRDCVDAMKAEFGEGTKEYNEAMADFMAESVSFDGPAKECTLCGVMAERPSSGFLGDGKEYVACSDCNRAQILEPERFWAMVREAIRKRSGS